MHELTQDQIDKVSGANSDDFGWIAGFATAGALGGAALSGPLAPVGFVVGGILGAATGLAVAAVVDHSVD